MSEKRDDGAWMGKPPAPKPYNPPQPGVQCALIAPKMIAAIVWRLCGGSEESCPFKLKDFL